MLPQSRGVESCEWLDDDVLVELAAGDAGEVLGVLDEGVDVGVTLGVQLTRNLFAE